MTVQEVGIIGLAAAGIALWGRMRFVLDWLRSLVVIRRKASAQLTGQLLAYLRNNAKFSPGDCGLYVSIKTYVRALGRAIVVFAENQSFGRQLFMLNQRPLWLSSIPSSPDDQNHTFSYIRGTFKWDDLLKQVGDWLNSQEHDNASRFRVETISGHGISNVSDDDGERSAEPAARPSTKTGKSGGIYEMNSCVRLLHWAVEDLQETPCAGLDDMSLRPEIRNLALDVSRIIADREWFESHLVPWRYGWFLHGLPGTGKTSFVRGLGQKHDMPIYRIDIASMANWELTHAWGIALRDTPCIVLFEDFDAVYDGRTNRVPNRGPSFDCLLNCLSGLETYSGVFVFVTSNHPDKLDPALRRGGRLDQAVEFIGFDAEGREKMARRILDDERDIQRAISDPRLIAMTPADLQVELGKIAFERRYAGYGD